jgi:hypothetical protein
MQNNLRNNIVRMKTELELQREALVKILNITPRNP